MVAWTQEVGVRFLLVSLALVVGACSPCPQIAAKADECGDEAFASPAWCETARRRATDPSTGMTLEEFDCLTACASEGTCDEYFDRMYTSCVCEDRCGVECL